MSANSVIATLIGDIVASRHHRDRRGLHRAVVAALDEVNDQLQPVQPLAPTIGDEFQGAFATVADAALASLLVRIKLLTTYRADSRYGLGHGAVTALEARRSPAPQDGPGWWSAREAIDRARRLADSPRTAFVRTCFGGVSEETAPAQLASASVEAFLLCRDAIVDEMTLRQMRLLIGSLAGQTQSELAAREGVTQPAVSQSLRQSGAFAIEAAHASLRRAAP